MSRQEWKKCCDEVMGQDEEKRDSRGREFRREQGTVEGVR